jgi:hypothetical protein
MSRSRSRERRRLAARYLAIANQTVDPKVRLFLIGMAQRWFDLAERDEDETLRGQTVQAAIAEELRLTRELPEKIPNWMLALLMQIDGGSPPRSSPDDGGSPPRSSPDE